MNDMSLDLWIRLDQCQVKCQFNLDKGLYEYVGDGIEIYMVAACAVTRKFV